MRQIWVPHFKKMAVKDLPPCSDPSDPPLASGELEKATQLVSELEKRFGPPDLIFTSHKQRCNQTAFPAVDRFGCSRNVVGLDTLAQPENGDLDPENPLADDKGLVYYGPRSYSPEWWELFMASFWRIMVEIHRHPELKDPNIWVFTHRPLVAAARRMTELGNQSYPLSQDAINALDPTILPFCIFECERGGLNWREVPRPQ